MKLNLTNDKPTNIIAGSARTCYSSKLINSQENESWSRKESLIDDLFKSGHHTTMQHSVITLEIEGVSRLLIWRLLHSHAFYNSDQVSQRYAKIIPGKDNFYYPKNLKKESVDDYFKLSFSIYQVIKEKLTKEYQKSSNKVVVKNAEKKAMEMARYVLPQAVKANLYHSINIITALRYIALANLMEDIKEEAMEFAAYIKEEILKIDPSYSVLIDEVESSINKKSYILPKIDLDEFPGIDKGNVKIFDSTPSYGLKNNAIYSNELMLGTVIHPNERVGGFSSRIKLSLSADAQNQRHRMAPAIRPDLYKYYLLKKNSDSLEYYVPKIIKDDTEVLKLYNEFFEYSESLIESLGLYNPEISYLIPNAFLIEIVERNDFSNFVHKAKMRTCHNAQEEIRDFTEEQISALKKTNPEIVSSFAPPCVIRFKEGVKPYCTEGVRYCGTKVWKIKRD